jgi:transposase
MTAQLGIDVSKAKLDVCLLREGEAKPLESSFANEPQGFQKLSRWLERHAKGEVYICLEATGRYGEAVAEYLHGRGYIVSVVNPAQIKAYAASQLQRNKTDRLDARLIADFCRTQQPPPWTPPPAEWRQLRALVRHYDDLKETLQQQLNRLEAGSDAPLVTSQLQAQVALLRQQMAEIRRQIEDHLDQHPDLKQQRDLLVSIPGIGDLTAGKLLAECRDVRRFDDVRQLVAFAGLNPRHRQSGSSLHGYTAISRMGRGSLRAALYMPALTAMRHNPLLRAFAERLRQRGLPGRAVVIAVMRKLLHLVYGILKSGHPFDPLYLSKQKLSA